MKIFRLYCNKIFRLIHVSALENNGERIEINLAKTVDYNNLDMYQKSHYKRYELARQALSGQEICGDFACGTGYGSIMLGQKTQKVIGVDIESRVVEKIRQRYKKNVNVEFMASNLLDLKFERHFDVIVSFETIEHFEESNIPPLFTIFSNALKKNGILMFSVPYMQAQTKEAITMGHHLTFNIDEQKIKNWLNRAGFKLETVQYQNYITHSIEDALEIKDFIICKAIKHE